MIDDFESMRTASAEDRQSAAALSSNGEVVVAAKSSHMIQFEEPGLVVDAIRRVHAAARDGTRLAQR